MRRALPALMLIAVCAACPAARAERLIRKLDDALGA